MEKILIVDDDQLIVESLISTLDNDDYKFFTDNFGVNALEILECNNIELVLLDVFLGKINGIDLLKSIREKFPNINVIMISGEADIETAITAVRLGAYDFLEKPLNRSKLKLTIKNAIENIKQKRENDLLKNQILESYSFQGRSSKINKVMELTEKSGRTNISVLITGENGTGKEIAARRVHASSKRAGKPFVAVNCAAIPENLLESELFGYKKGAFTGADKDKEGMFIKANKGTLFLDEVGDMDLHLQAKLLRVLQEKEVLRVGGVATEKVDARFISATNRDLLKMVSEGSFREDLFYRLNGLEITIPPLRSRPEDIPVLVSDFVKEFCFENNLTIPEINDNALKELMKYSFSGNIRELKNIVHRTLALCENQVINNFLLYETKIKNIAFTESLGPLKETRQKLLAMYLSSRLSFFEGNRKKLADELGIHINNLYRMLKSAGVG